MKDKIADLVSTTITDNCLEETTMGFIGPPRQNPNRATLMIDKISELVAERILSTLEHSRITEILRPRRVSCFERISILHCARRGDMDDWPRYQVRVENVYGLSMEREGPSIDILLDMILAKIRERGGDE